jgi:hypothetical protein
MTISSGMWDVLRALAHQASYQIDTRPGNRTPGKVALIWAKYHAEVEALVRADKLTAVQILPEREAAAAEKHDAAPSELGNTLVWWNPKGGWPLPHFHLGDKLYPATEGQWNSFSAGVLSKVGANLQSAKAKVSFEQLVQITEQF